MFTSIFVVINKRNLKILSLKANHRHIMFLYTVIQDSALVGVGVVFRGNFGGKCTVFEKVTVKPRKTVRRLLPCMGKKGAEKHFGVLC